MKRTTGLSSPCGGLLKKSTMSLPAQKQSGWPAISTTRTSGSRLASSKASASAVYIAPVIEFFLSGRLKRTVSTRSSSERRMRASDMGFPGR